MQPISSSSFGWTASNGGVLQDRPFNTNIKHQQQTRSKEKGLTKAAIAIAVEVDGHRHHTSLSKLDLDGQHNFEEETSPINRWNRA
eukprot:scaffold6143_cov147-Skeletonema_dohrnii-CCMP3373.AAC.12